jgi:hypothetical protein
MSHYLLKKDIGIVGLSVSASIFLQQIRHISFTALYFCSKEDYWVGPAFQPYISIVGCRLASADYRLSGVAVGGCSWLLVVGCR